MNKIIAVVVLYNPDINSVIEQVDNLLSEVATVILVDNSYVSNSERLQQSDVVYYLHNRNRDGIAGAHNLGIIKSFELDCDGVILFDQDSKPGLGFVNSLKSDYMKMKDHGYKLAAIGPTPVNVQTNEAYKPRIDRRKNFDKVTDVIQETQLISSGKLIPKEVLLDVGFMEERLFIDGVDSEWCWRARKSGYEIAMSKNTKMLHMLGEGDRKIFGIAVATTSSFRLYYQFRNYVLFLPRGYVPFYWKLVNGIKYSIKFFYYGVFITPRKKNLKGMLKGLLDGIRGV